VRLFTYVEEVDLLEMLTYVDVGDGQLKRLHGTLLKRNWILFFDFHRKMVTLPPDIRGKRTPKPSER